MSLPKDFVPIDEDAVESSDQKPEEKKHIPEDTTQEDTQEDDSSEEKQNLIDRFKMMMDWDYYGKNLSIVSEILDKMEKSENDGDNYSRHGENWAVKRKWGPLPDEELLCPMCQPVYENILCKELSYGIGKNCAYCGEWKKDVYVSRRHDLCACSHECAENLAEKFGFPMSHFEGDERTYHL